MGVVILIGRILLSLIFLASGVGGHLAQADNTAGYGEARGLKNAKILTQISGVLIAAAGLGVILGVWIDVAALGMFAYSLISAFLIHHFWTDEDEMTATMEMSLFMKNISMAGGALILFGVASSGADIGWTLTDVLFG